MQVAYGDEVTADVSTYHVNCFGICCDMRKSVIAVNGVMLGIQILAMIVIGVGGSMMGSAFNDMAADIDDDYQKQQMEEFSQQAGAAGGMVIGFLELLIFVGVIFTSLGIFGALKFNKCALITTSVFYSLSILGNLLSFNSDIVGQSLINVALPCLFLYPHVCMLRLMDQGIMTPENYHRVQKGCC